MKLTEDTMKTAPRIEANATDVKWLVYAALSAIRGEDCVYNTRIVGIRFITFITSL